MQRNYGIDPNSKDGRNILLVAQRLNKAAESFDEAAQLVGELLTKKG